MSSWFDWTKAPRATGTPSGAKPPSPLPPQIYNPGTQGQDARYDVRSLPKNEQGQRYDQYGNTYDDNGLLIGGSRAKESLPGLKPANQMDGDQWGDYLRNGGASGAGAGIGSAFMGDPILAQAQALASRQREVARSAALAKRKQAAVEYGDASGVTGLDEATIAAARDNPFSVLSNLKRGYEEGVESLENDLNASNLFYSGYRGKELGRAATDYQGQRSSAASSFQSLLSDVENALAQALLQADWAEMDALQGAYARALSEALDYGYGYPGSTGADTGSNRQMSLYDQFVRQVKPTRTGTGVYGTSKPSAPAPRQGSMPATKAAQNTYLRLLGGKR